MRYKTNRYNLKFFYIPKYRRFRLLITFILKSINYEIGRVYLIRRVNFFINFFFLDQINFFLNIFFFYKNIFLKIIEKLYFYYRAISYKIVYIYIKLICIQLNLNYLIFYLYSTYYFFQTSCNRYWSMMKLIKISNILLIHSYVNFYLKLFLSYFFRLLFIKMRFLGKGYKLFIKKNNYHFITIFNFGYSHRYYIYLYHFFTIQLAKTKFLFFGLNFYFKIISEYVIFL